MRLKAIEITFGACFLLLFLALVNLQVIQGAKFYQLSENNRIRLKPLEAPRGLIYDRNGKLLVDNRLCFEAKIVPHLLGGEIPRPLTGEFRRLRQEQILRRLAEILGLSPDSLKQMLKKAQAESPFLPYPVSRNVSKQQAVVILEEGPAGLPGVVVEAKPRRYYPYRHSAAHLLGYPGKITRIEYEELKEYGFRPDDLMGRTGVEKTFDSILRGQNGGQLVEVDKFGRMVRILDARPPSPGGSIHLTIDVELQQFVEKLLSGRRGAVTLMEAGSGEILAMASSPGFDANFFVNSPASEQLKMLKSEKARRKGKLLNRNIQCAFPPGSIFKIITGACGLETGRLKDEDVFICPGEFRCGDWTFHCWQYSGHGPIGLKRALARSCNVFFYHVGLNVGVDSLGRFAHLFGLGEPVGIELPGEVSGLVPTRRWKKTTIGERWYQGDTVNFSIGQGYLSATPLQVLKLISIIANDGVPASPHLIKEVESGLPRIKGQVSATFISRFWKERRHRMISSRTARKIKQGLIEAVVDQSGTGHRAYVAGIGGAGKTGTASAGRGRPHAWFAGFAPAENPEICLVVFLEHGGRGGDQAAEIAAAIWSRVLGDRGQKTEDRRQKAEDRSQMSEDRSQGISSKSQIPNGIRYTERVEVVANY